MTMSAQQGPATWLLRSVGHDRPDPKDDPGREAGPEATRQTEPEPGPTGAGDRMPQPEPDTAMDDGTGDGTDTGQDWGTGEDPWEQFTTGDDPVPTPQPRQEERQDGSRPLPRPEPQTGPSAPANERAQDPSARDPQPDTTDTGQDRFTQAEIHDGRQPDQDDEDWGLDQDDWQPSRNQPEPRQDTPQADGIWNDDQDGQDTPQADTTDDDGWQTGQDDDEGWGFDQNGQDDRQPSRNQPDPQQDNATQPSDDPDSIWADNQDGQDTPQADTATQPIPRPHTPPNDQDDAPPDTLWPDTTDDDAHDYTIPQDDFGRAIAPATDTRHTQPWKRIAIITAAALAIAGLTAGAIHTGSTMIARHREQTQKAQQDNSLADTQNAFTRDQNHLKTQVGQVKNSPVATDPSLKTPLAQAEAASNLPTPMNNRDITTARRTITTAADTLERAYKPLIDKSISQQQERLRSLVAAADGLKGSPDGQERRAMTAEADGLRGTTVTRDNIRDVISRLDRLDGDVKAVQRARDEAAKAEEARKAQDQSQQAVQPAPQPQAQAQAQAPSYTPQHRYNPGYNPAPQSRPTPAPAPAPAPAPVPAPAQPGGSVGIEG